VNGVEEAPPPVPEARRGLLGEILIREGLINEGQLSTALMVQRETEPTTPLGQILVRQGAITQRQLNNVLDRYRKKYRLGDILVETNVISETQLQLGVDHHRRTGLRLGDALLQLGFVNEEMLKLALCTQLDVAFIDLDRFSIDRGLASIVPKNFAQQHRVLPVARVDGVLTVALADPTDGWVAENIESMTGCDVRLVMSTDTAPAVAMPNSAARWAARATAALAMRVFVGMQPVLTQVPPTFPRSRMATFMPAAARRAARAGPAWPVPMTIAS